jgi:predicted signal transduction protein with EAL and GGDEF domain
MAVAVQAPGLGDRAPRRGGDARRPTPAPEGAYAGLLEQVALAANQAAGLEEALAFALARIADATGWSAAHVWMASAAPAPARLTSTALWHGADGDRFAALRAAALPADRPYAGLPGRVLATAQAVVIADAAADRDFPRRQAVQAAGLRSAFAVPVFAQGDVAAVLEFFDRHTRTPDPELLATLQRVCGQLGRVAERQQRHDRLLHDTSHDALTGLPNRSLFLDRLGRALARGRRHARARFAVLFIDLDRFHLVNDSFGHAAGDQLLLQVAGRISHVLRSSDMVARTGSPEAAAADTLARLGGDEFTVLLDDVEDPSDALRVAERVQEALAPPFAVAGSECFMAASIGIAFSPPGFAAPEQVLRDADLAMGRAKALGGNRAELYDQQLHAAARARMAMETDLRRALAHQAFELHYQPIIDLPTGAISSVEALVRWRKSPDELVYPGEFIPLAEDTGLILPLGLWVLREACRSAHAWHKEFQNRPALGIGINLSARQFAHPGFVGEVERILAETGINPATVRLEITESALVGGAPGNLDRAVEVFTRLKQLGVRLGLDDFGTGYSSLSYLHRFPLDIVKIDRSFVAQLGRERESQAIIKTIMDLARSLNLQIVAEGAETATHVGHLRSLGCPQAQGFFFARPMDAAHLRQLLAHAA